MTRASAAWIALAIALCLLPGCAPRSRGLSAAEVDSVARRYLALAFQLGLHDPYYVDSYYGPPEVRTAAERDSLSAPAIAAAADSLVALLSGRDAAVADAMDAMRLRFLRMHLAALAVRARMAAGDTLEFVPEARALYDIAVPPVSEERLSAALAVLDSLLPGPGPLVDRYQRFRSGFEIPAARLDTLMRVAMAEARRRTLAHIPLPDSERVTIEYVRGQPWGAYNWYQGGYRSRIQVNVDQPLPIDRVIDLASHEGYPGHHALNVMMEHGLVNERGWREFSLFPLYGPLALIAEGTASLAPEIAFPGGELAEFERTVLFPLAGIDPSRHAEYARVRAAMDSLELAGIENGRRYLDGRIPRGEAVRRGMRFALYDSTRSERHVRFLERYRSYIVNYGLGKREVRAWLAANGGGADPGERWRLYRRLISAPHLPADLRAPARP